MVEDTKSDTRVERRSPPEFSVPALLFGAVIVSLGLMGVLVGASHVTWSRAAALALIVGGLLATIGLAIRWISLSR